MIPRPLVVILGVALLVIGVMEGVHGFGAFLHLLPLATLRATH